VEVLVTWLDMAGTDGSWLHCARAQRQDNRARRDGNELTVTHSVITKEADSARTSSFRPPMTAAVEKCRQTTDSCAYG